MTPRVLFLDHVGVLGGAELSLLDIAEAWRNHSTVLLLADGPFRVRLLEAGVDVEVLPTSNHMLKIRRESKLPSPRGVSAVMAAVWSVARRAREHDVLYANSQKAFVIAALAGVISVRPVIWHLRDILSQVHFSAANISFAVALANRIAKRVVANSRVTAATFVASGGKASRVRVVHNGVDHLPFDRVTAEHTRELRDELRLADSFVVGVFGRLHSWKGQHVAIEAMSLVARMHLIIVGEALFGEQTYKEGLRQQVQTLGLEDRVHFLGFRRDVPALMRAVDVIAHTSVAPEPFGRVVVEGMLSGRAVVAAEDGGVLEILQPGVTGMLVPPGDAAALAQALTDLASDPDLRRALGRAGRDHARRAFSKQAMLAGVAAQIDEVLHR